MTSIISTNPFGTSILSGTNDVDTVVNSVRTAIDPLYFKKDEDIITNGNIVCNQIESKHSVVVENVTIKDIHVEFGASSGINTNTNREIGMYVSLENGDEVGIFKQKTTNKMIIGRTPEIGIVDVMPHDFVAGATSVSSLTTSSLQVVPAVSAGHVLTSDAMGNATWQAPTGGGGAPSNMVTTDTPQTISGTKTFSGGIRVSSGASSGHVLTSDAMGNVTWQSVPTPASMVTTNTPQTISGAKTFSAGLTTSTLRVSTGASSGYVLKSDAQGNGTWQPESGGGGGGGSGGGALPLTESTSQLSVSGTTLFAPATQNLMPVITYPSSLLFSGVKSVTIAISGTIPVTWSGGGPLGVNYAGVRLKTSGGLTLLTKTIGTVTGAQDATVSYNTTETFTLTIPDASNVQSYYPLTIEQFISGGDSFNLSTATVTIIYETATNTQPVYLDKSLTMDNDRDNIVVGSFVDCGDNVVQVKLKDVVNMLFAQFRKSSMWTGSQFTVHNMYNVAGNGFWWTNTSDTNSAPVAIEIRAKLKPNVVPIYITIDPGGGFDTVLDAPPIGVWIPDKLLHIKTMLFRSPASGQLTVNPWSARTQVNIGATIGATYTDMWDGKTSVNYDGNNKLSTYMYFMLANPAQLAYNTQSRFIGATNGGGTGPSYSISGPYETSTTIYDYFDVFQIRALVQTSLFSVVPRNVFTYS